VTWIANDGTDPSSPVTSTINVTAVNDPPVLTAGGVLNYTESQAATAIDTTITAADVDDTDLESATVQITGNYQNGQDVLGFVDMLGISGVFTPATGTLTLTGTSSVANYQTALRTVTYQNTSEDPSTAVRTVTWIANDGTDPSSPVTSTINVTAVNDPPVLTAGGVLNYTENQAATAIDTTITAADVDDTDLESATVQITGNYQNGQDVLGFVDMLGISGMFTPATGTLTLTGTSSVANYQTALRSVTYVNTSEDPSTAVRTVTWIANDGTDPSTPVTSTINVTAVNDPPVLTAGATLNYTENDPATAIDTTITAMDVDDTNLESATVQITSNYVNGQDVLGFVNMLGISGVFAPATGTLTLTGTSSVANYQTALRSVTYVNTSEDPSAAARTVTWIANDGTDPSPAVTNTINVIPVNDPPVAADDSWDTIGNTQLVVDLPVLLTPHVRDTTGSGFGARDNDSDPAEGDNHAVTAIIGCSDLTPPFTCPTANGGTVVMNAEGTFTYTPAAGDVAASDSFQYTLTDDGTPLPASDNATVTINRFERVWYVRNNAAAGGFGRSADPFDTLAEAQTASQPNDYIFVHFGNGMTTGQAGGIALKGGQHLIGEHAGLSIPVNLNGNGSPAVLFAAVPGNRPMLDDTAAGVPEGVDANDVVPVEIVGMNLAGNVNAINWVTNAAFAGSGSFSIRDNVVRSAGAAGVDINLAGTGALNLAFHDNNLTSTGTALAVSETGTGSLTITAFDDNVVSGDTGSSGIVVSGAIFDTTAGAPFNQVSGGVTLIGASGNGVGGSGLVLTGVAGDLAFTDLDIFADGGAGLIVSGAGAVNVGAGTGTRVTVGAGVGIVEATGGPAASLSGLTADMQFTSLQSINTTSTGVSLTNVSDATNPAFNAVFSAGSGSSITTAAGASGPAFNVSGGNADISYAGTITNNSAAARAVSLTTWSGDDATDDITLSGAIDENGAGILVNGNSGTRPITFSGGMDIDTTTGEGFAATSNTNTGGLHITGTNDITSTSATALRVTNTTIGSSNLNFRNISSGNNTAAADPASGIVLNATGTSGRLIVTGSGASGQGGNGTGGLIQNTTSHGISLTDTMNPSFTNMTIQTTAGSGVNGTQVSGFTFDNGTINGSGDALGESNIAFNGSGTLLGNNLTGVVTITDSVLNTALDAGIHIQSNAGTISNANLSNNSLTSTTSTGTSKGCAIKLIGTGTATTVGNVTQAAIANNVIANFPSACGIQVIGGNVNATGPAGFVGDPTPGTEVISITGNSISGQSAVNRMGTSAIEVSVNGGNSSQRSQGNFIVSNNNPLTNMAGTAILAGHNGYADGTYVMDGNVIVANNTVASQGIGGGNGIVSSSAETPNMTWTITNNNISNTDGNGILAVGRGVSGTLNIAIRNNTVGAPLTGVRPGIRVDAGNSSSLDDAVCADISNNVSGGSGGHAGLGIRKQGTNATINDFGIEGLSPSPATCGQAEDHVSSQNPGAVATGTDCDGNPGSKTLAISGSNFVTCNTAP
jgi:hypothetical protein